MSFIDTIKANGFGSIEEYLEASRFLMNDTPDFTDAELRAIRKSEQATENYLEAIA